MRRWLGGEDFKTMPWANGKGVTVELARADQSGEMLWRLSRASVVEDGPFSVFAGIDRVLTVLTGPGFDLLGDGISLQARPWVPVAFAGDLPMRAAGVTAPSDDFNVMTARHLGPAQVRVLTHAETVVPGGLSALYWPDQAKLLLTDEPFGFIADGPAVLVGLPV